MPRPAQNRSDDVVTIVAAEDYETTRLLQERLTRKIEVEIDELAANVKAFVERLGRVMAASPTDLGQYVLEEIEVSAEITTRGQLVVWGIGGEAGLGSGIRFTFKKKTSG